MSRDFGSNFCRPPYSSCRTPQTKRELLGVRYAIQGVDGCETIDDLAPACSSAALCTESVKTGRRLRLASCITTANRVQTMPDHCIDNLSGLRN